jgi:putative hydrolase of the HAD superfamily
VREVKRVVHDGADMNDELPSLAVTFDFGQTLCDLDTGMRARRLGERGIEADERRLEAAVPAAWRAYDAAIHQGLGGHPWRILMREILRGAALSGAIEDTVEWLWTEQPNKNLWRRPIPGMIEVVLELRREGVPVGVISNSEGRLAELIDEIGWAAHFLVVADSGRLGLEKPGEAIFRATAERLATPVDRVAHVGDSLAADVEGALNAGMRALWFRPLPGAIPAPRAALARDATEVRRALAGWGLLGGSAAQDPV